MTTLDDIRAWNPLHMADAAEAFDPDTIAEREGEDDSPGAVFLRSVWRATLEAVETAREEGVAWSDLAEHLTDAFHEIADAAPDVYTHTRWREFVDLGAYREDLSEWGPIDPEDIERAVAGVALYQMADRLARAIVEELAEQDFEDE